MRNPKQLSTRIHEYKVSVREAWKTRETRNVAKYLTIVKIEEKKTLTLGKIWVFFNSCLHFDFMTGMQILNFYFLFSKIMHKMTVLFQQYVCMETLFIADETLSDCAVAETLYYYG